MHRCTETSYLDEYYNRETLNDMVDDGVSVEDALNFIITESIVESKVNELLKDNDDLFGGEFEILDDGMVEVVIKSWDDV